MSIGWMLISALGSASLLAWVVLAFFRGWFWLPGPWLERSCSDTSARRQPDLPEIWPDVHAIVPARNEAIALETTVSALRAQRYPGGMTLTVVDDQSTDATHELLARLAGSPGEPIPSSANRPDRRPVSLSVVCGRPLPAGWAGKVWAMQQGWEDVTSRQAASDTSDSFILFTDADIRHDPDVVEHLVVKALSENRDLVSVMAHLRLDSFWDRLLIPAFVYFFAKLYPFRWVASSSRRTAAAAGGCSLIRGQALQQIGGPSAIASALIDDCALARAVAQTCGNGVLWLGMSRTSSVRSTRSYGRLGDLWNMVARSAFHQLRNSSVLLAATVLGMLLVYVVPLASLFVPIVSAIRGVPGSLVGWLPGAAAWTIMTCSYIPILRTYRASPVMSLLLPLSALLYTAMTVTSAFRTWLGRGGVWKGRTYAG